VPEPVHVHAPHELSEPSEAEKPHERVLEIIAALLMSLATLGIAWSGYQAARWGGIQARHYAQASAARTEANLAAGIAATQKTQDLINFNDWLDLTVAGDTELAALYERRFREEFRPAFNAWVAEGAVTDAAATPSPLLRPEYKLAGLETSAELEHTADGKIELAHDATENADSFVFATVFFAAVLFFSGMSLRFGWIKVRIAVLVLATLFLAYGIYLVGKLPAA
jgi:hypothetical protein